MNICGIGISIAINKTERKKSHRWGRGWVIGMVFKLIVIPKFQRMEVNGDPESLISLRWDKHNI